MKPTRCPRLFEVEAARDGRLTGAELASFERHMTGCPACLREAEALEGLADSLRASPPGGVDLDMLHMRRERTRLLAAFDRALVGPQHYPGVRRGLLGAGAVAVVVACVLVFGRVRSGVQPMHAGATIHADAGAVWSRHGSDHREEIDLDRGALWIHVDHSAGEERLVVVLPDGELEDTGTTFTVSADDGHTTRVAVEDGRVVLRIRGESAVALGAGDTWKPGPLPAGRPPASSAPLAAAPDARLDAVERGMPPPATPAAPPSAADPSVDFRTAMAALDVGDNHQAALGFASFLAKHPQDARAEDAAYLRVIALQRSGDAAGMKQAAREYLRRYPSGFRQADVERLER
jgi:hypothetical protein